MYQKLKQLVFLSILLDSRNKVAIKANRRTKDAAVRNEYLTRQKERRHG